MTDPESVKDVVVVTKYLDEKKEPEEIAQELGLPLDEVKSYLLSVKKQDAVTKICDEIASRVYSRTAPIMNAIAGTSLVAIFEGLNEIYTSGRHKDMKVSELKALKEIANDLSQLARLHEGKSNQNISVQINERNLTIDEALKTLKEADEFVDYEVEDEEITEESF